jgi:anti-sigma regulatory factor (Ser/Thr protein kinase)
MDKAPHIRFNAQERSYLAILKKDVHALALEAGFTDPKMADIDIVVAELCSNLVKHAKDGELLVRTDETGLELIALDSGPGMSDVARMSADGMSTTNTLGHGLGAIRRLSDFCDIYSLKGWGTVSVCRFFLKPAVKNPLADIHSIILPKPGEQACGDGIAIQQTAKTLKILAGDGLGHGPGAEEVAQKAKAVFLELKDEYSAVELIRGVHTGVKRTRGLVATVAVYLTSDKSWHICGTGNITNWIGNQQHNKSIMCYNGIVGVNIPGSMNEYVVKNEYGQLLILASDGLRTRWDLQKYPSILKHDLSLLAAALYKDYSRGNDDLSILIARIKQS